MLTCKLRRIFLKDVVVCCRCINPDANENVKGPTTFCTRFSIHQKVIIIIFLTEHNYLKRTVVVMGDYLTVTHQEDRFEEALVNHLKVL